MKLLILLVIGLEIWQAIGSIYMIGKPRGKYTPSVVVPNLIINGFITYILYRALALF